MKCPWCGEEISLDKYIDHLTTCPRYKKKEKITQPPENTIPTVTLFTYPTLRKLFGEMQRYIAEEDLEEILKVGMGSLINVGLLYRDVPSKEILRFIHNLYDALCMTILSAYRNNWTEASRFLDISMNYVLALPSQDWTPTSFSFPDYLVHFQFLKFYVLPKKAKPNNPNLRYYAKIERAVRKIRYVADVLAESYGTREESLVKNLDEAIELLKG